MRKREKEKILSLLGSMEEAHAAILRFLTEKKAEEAIALLSLCQEGMEKCGNEVEVQEERGEDYSPLFFSYLETLFHCYEATQAEQWNQAKSILENGVELYHKILQTIEDLEEQVLMLFLPYKASMWDSMESVYLAAKKDPSCIPLVMPISYLQRSNEKEELFNERENFPEDIPLIGEDFSLEEQKPDCIFIHYPYDDKNYVTSVHPRYYTTNLKQYTDCLVYIPYFTSMGILTNDPLSLVDFQYVDYIVAQNEVHRASFPSGARDKCLLLGSPKFDRVLKLNREDFDIPKEWEEMARGKKLIFFNTSITLMLENTEAFLDKLEEVLQLAKEQKDYCLLWRPHPLLENTLRSIRNAFLERFLQLKEDFIRGKWGIFDDSPYMERAMCIADMYLGDDGSSMVNLFAMAKKEIFILENRLLDREKDPEHRIIKTAMEAFEEDCAAVYEGRILLEGRREGETFHISKRELSKYLGKQEISGDGYLKAFPFFDKKSKEEQWILPPYSGNKIYRLQKDREPKSSSLQTVSYRPNAFSDWKRIGNHLYGKPAFYENLVSLSEDGVLREGEKLSLLLRSVAAGQVYPGGMLYRAPHLIFPIRAEKSLLFVEESRFEKSLFSLLGEEGPGFSDLFRAKEEDCLWALPISGTVLYKISLSKRSWEKYDLAIASSKSALKKGDIQEDSLEGEVPEVLGYDAFHGGVIEEYLYSSIYETEEKLWIAPQNGEKLLCMDKKTATVSAISPDMEALQQSYKQEWEEPLEEDWKREERLWKKRSGGRFFSFRGEDYYYDNRKNRLYLMKEDKMQALQIQLDFALEDLCSGFLPWERSLYSIREGDLYTLKDYLEGKALAFPFSQDKLEKRLDTVSYNMDGTAGEKIYQFFAKECRKEKE